MSSIDLMVSPAACKAVIALSRPLPGPLTLTSTSRTPNFIAFSAACWAAICPANGVLFLLPLNPHVPELAQQRVSPFVSVIVTVVLLKVALMYAMPTATFRRVLRRVLVEAALATGEPAPLKVVLCYVLAHDDYRRSFTPFFPATVFFGPFRVRALVRVRCPRTGNPRR